MEKKRVVFATYKLLHKRFKEICDLSSCTVTDRMTYLVQSYINGEITLYEIQGGFKVIKEKIKDDRKDYQMSLTLDVTLYEQLINKLHRDKNVRPATFFSLAMGYFVCMEDTPEHQKERYAHEAKLILESADSSVSHVVYGLRYYALNDGKWEAFSEKFFLDVCSEERFKEVYPDTPALFVYAVHR